MRQWLGLLALCALIPWSQAVSAKEITIGFPAQSEPFSIPDRRNPGISVEIVREAFKLIGHEIKPVFQPYRRIVEEVRRGRLDATMAMSNGDPSLHYSEPCIAFDNVAIVRKRDNITVNGIGDLPGHSVVAWQNAHDHLGGEFQRLFGSHVTDDYISKYFDLPDQTAQVRMFWSGRADIIVIDDVIFDYITSKMADDFDTGIPLERNRIFGGLTVFSIAFDDPELRDQFNVGVAKLRASGGIDRIYEKYRSAKIHRTANAQ